MEGGNAVRFRASLFGLLPTWMLPVVHLVILWVAVFGIAFGPIWIKLLFLGVGLAMLISLHGLIAGMFRSWVTIENEELVLSGDSFQTRIPLSRITACRLDVRRESWQIWTWPVRTPSSFVQLDLSEPTRINGYNFGWHRKLLLAPDEPGRFQSELAEHLEVAPPNANPA